MARKIRGTIAELAALGLTANGVKLDANQISTLTRLHMARAVDTKVTGQRGPAATVWELDATVPMDFAEIPKAA